MGQSSAIMIIIGLCILAVISLKVSAEYDKRKIRLKQEEQEKLERKKFEKVIPLEDIYIGKTYEYNYVALNQANGVIEVYNVDSITGSKEDKILEEYTIAYEQIRCIEVLENGALLGSTADMGNKSILGSFNKKDSVDLLQIKFILNDQSYKMLTLLRVKTKKSMAIYQRNVDRARQILEEGKIILGCKTENIS